MQKITSKNPKSESNPDVPYDYVLPYFSFAPVLDNKYLKFSASLSCKLAREINGDWEIWPELHYAESANDISNDVNDDPALAELVSTINQALSKFLSDRGV
jgi:hypothetical protein